MTDWGISKCCASYRIFLNAAASFKGFFSNSVNIIRIYVYTQN